MPPYQRSSPTLYLPEPSSSRHHEFAASSSDKNGGIRRADPLSGYLLARRSIYFEPVCMIYAPVRSLNVAIACMLVLQRDFTNSSKLLWAPRRSVPSAQLQAPRTNPAPGIPRHFCFPPTRILKVRSSAPITDTIVRSLGANTTRKRLHASQAQNRTVVWPSTFGPSPKSRSTPHPRLGYPCLVDTMIIVIVAGLGDIDYPPSPTLRSLIAHSQEFSVDDIGTHLSR